MRSVKAGASQQNICCSSSNANTKRLQIVKKAKIWFGVLFGVFLLLNIPLLAVTLHYSLIVDPFSMRLVGLKNYTERISFFDVFFGSGISYTEMS